MVIANEDIYLTSAEVYQTHSIHKHRRYPSSLPTIKDQENRGKIDGSSDALLSQAIPNKFKTSSPFSTHLRHKSPSDAYGRTPSIISTEISPTVTRSSSQIRKKKRFMFSPREVKEQFFYPVNGPKRRSLRTRGKYRNSVELKAIMDYIKMDSTMSKALCMDQKVVAFEVRNRQLYKPSPTLEGKVKVLTLDSNNNYIIYTPNPTIGKNSVISDAEQRLDDELVKLGKPLSFSESFQKPDNNMVHNSIPEKKIKTLTHHDNFTSLSNKSELLRTYSLPKSQNSEENLKALWNLYLRRVIAERIKWRLKNSNSNTPIKKFPGETKISRCTSVDTDFFITTSLDKNAGFPNEYKTPVGSFVDSEERDVSSSEDDCVEPLTDNEYTGESIMSSTDNIPRRAAMLDSLEQLMVEVGSVMSELS